MSNKVSLQSDKFSKSRALNATILTLITITFGFILIYHLIWSVKVVYYQPFGNILNNIVYGPGTLLLNFGLTTKLIKWANSKLLEDKIEEDYKKYI
ncbi:unnamed protein product [Candida verbasci]|uniref:Uncharacterized protein n=1 Tax=Candida verbasci TaxID=1227364 RepID=A0A9W4TYF5_9ASCO|nr:unnamed protein product [Candida verbasci]